MDSLDREIAEAFAEQPLPEGPGRLLVAARSGEKTRRLMETVQGRGHGCVRVGGLAEVREAAAADGFDLLLLDPALAGADVAQALRDCPARKTVVLAQPGCFEQAVAAVRCGALDLIDADMPSDEIARRIESALSTARTATQHEQRLARLTAVCRKLADTRHEIVEHLDRLSRDLVAAYQDVAEQVSEAAMATEFRTLLKQELDLEDLLRTALEYLLTRTAPTNAAVFLPDTNGNFELGAYVNYDCARESITALLGHLCRVVCPHMAEETEIVSFEDAAEFAQWIGAEADLLAGCQVVAFSCHHDERCLAVMILFRSRNEPFEEPLAGTLDILRSIFAEQIANVIRVHNRAESGWPKDPLDDEYDSSDYDDYGFGGLVA